MWQQRFFTEQIAATGHPMVQWDGLNRERAVFVYDTLLGRVNWVKLNVIAHVATECVQHRSEQWAKSGFAIDMHARRAAKQTEGAEHADQTEAMVTMQVRNKDMAKLVERQPGAAHLQLCTLTAVYHEELPTTVDDLCRGVMMQGRQGASASKDMQSESFHDVQFT
jgi:hypothetical protein